MSLLDKVLLSEDASRSWHNHAASPQVQSLLKGIRPSDIPDEDARLEADGSLTIFIILPTGVEIRMNISPSDWTWLTLH